MHRMSRFPGTNFFVHHPLFLPLPGVCSDTNGSVAFPRPKNPPKLFLLILVGRKNITMLQREKGRDPPVAASSISRAYAGKRVMDHIFPEFFYDRDEHGINPAGNCRFCTSIEFLCGRMQHCVTLASTHVLA